MNLFLDTSSLIRLYHTENGTSETDNIFLSHQITSIFLSAISKLEFTSALWKKTRMKEIKEDETRNILLLFERDYEKYRFVAVDILIFEQAKKLINKYGLQGLRTLDAIQLSTAVSLFSQVNLFQTGDKLLQSFFESEGLPIKI